VAQSEGSCRQTFFVSKAADAFYDSGKLYHIDGQHELAIQDYTEAIRLDPQYAIAYRGRGVVYSCWLSAQMGQKVNGDFELIMRAL